MPSLKAIRKRIGSVKNTRKITRAIVDAKRLHSVWRRLQHFSHISLHPVFFRLCYTNINQFAGYGPPDKNNFSLVMTYCFAFIGKSGNR